MEYTSIFKIENGVISFSKDAVRKIESSCKYRIIGEVFKGNRKQAVGYIMFNSALGKSAAVSKENILIRLHNPNFEIQNAKLSNGEIVYTECGQNKMPEFDIYGNPKELNVIHVISRIEVCRDNKIEQVGYHIIDGRGKSIDVTKDGLLKLAKTRRLVNAKIVEKDGTTFISGIKQEIVAETIKVKKDKIPVKQENVDYEKEIRKLRAANDRKARHIRKIETSLDRRIDCDDIYNYYADRMREDLTAQDLKWYLTELPDEYKSIGMIAADIANKTVARNSNLVTNTVIGPGTGISKKEMQILVCLITREIIRADLGVVNVYWGEKNKPKWGDRDWVFRLPYLKVLKENYPELYKVVEKYKEEQMKKVCSPSVQYKAKSVESELLSRIENIDYYSDIAFEKAGFTRDISRAGQYVDGYRGKVLLKYFTVLPYWFELWHNIKCIGDFLICTEAFAMMLNNGFVCKDGEVQRLSLSGALEYMNINKIQSMDFFDGRKSGEGISCIVLKNDGNITRTDKVKKSIIGYLPDSSIKYNQISANLSLIKIFNPELYESIVRVLQSTIYGEYILNNTEVKYTGGYRKTEGARIFYESGARAMQLCLSPKDDTIEKINHRYINTYNLYNRTHEGRIDGKLKQKLDIAQNLVKTERSLLEAIGGKYSDVYDTAKLLSNATLKNVVYN